MKTKHTYADAFDWAESQIPLEELGEDLTFNPTLLFMPKSPDYPLFKEIHKILIGILEATPFPEGFRPPIAPGPKRSQASHRNLETLIANFVVLAGSKKKTLAVSLSPNTYARTHLTRGIIDLYRLMHEAKLVAMKVGFKFGPYPRMTRLKPKRQLQRLLRGIGSDSAYSEPIDLINLRARRKWGQKQGDFIPRNQWPDLTLGDVQMLDTLRACLQWFNLVLREYDMDYRSEKDGKRHLLFPVLYTSYTENFKQGGRFYTGRGGHTNLSAEERATIRFDNHKTTERDFDGLHIRMLYHLNDRSFPLNLDAYGAVLNALGKTPHVVFDDFPGIRDDLKETLLALINDTGSEAQAIGRAKWRLFHSPKQEKDVEQRRQAKAAAEQRARQWQQVGLTAESIVKAFHQAHRPIAHEFSAGKGLRLQNLDAAIARWVMMQMMVSNVDQCVPTLPVHDSFITFNEFSGVLRTVMQDSYQAVLRGESGCKKAYKIPIKP